MNLVDALCHCSDLLVKFGGHELAAGLSVTRGQLDSFREKINEYARENLSESDMVPTFETDAVIDFTDANLDLAEQLRILEPYGVGNPIPSFAVMGVTVAEMVGVSEGKHTRFTFTDGRGSVSAMCFSNSPSSLGVFVGDIVDILFNIDINEWYGKKSVQFIIRDIRISKAQTDAQDHERSRFEEIKAGAPFDQEENVYPTRDDFAALYKFIVNSVRNGYDTLTVRDLSSKVARTFGTDLGYIKLKFMIMVMREMNIITIEELTDESYKFVLHYSSGKTDLEKSNILRRLRSQMTRK